MKVFITLVVVALVAGGALAVTKEQLEKSEEIIQECNKDGQISKEQLEKIKQGDLTDADENVKCLAKCFFEKVGFVKDGVVQEDVIVAKLTKDGSNKDKVMKSINACRDQGGADNCEKAFNIYKCFIEQEAAKS